MEKLKTKKQKLSEIYKSRITVIISDEQLEKLTKACNKRHLSISTLLRDIIDNMEI